MKKLIIDVGIFFERVAILSDNGLEYVDYKLEKKLSVGDLYLAKVKAINQSNKSAFLELSQEQEAYLGDNVESIKAGDMIIVQVSKEAFGTKLPTVNSDISMPGKNIVFLPKGKGLKYSRKLQSLEGVEALAAELEEALSYGGAILRSGADVANGEVIKLELKSLMEDFEGLAEDTRLMNKPRILKSANTSYEEIINTNRDALEIITNDKSVFKNIKASSFIQKGDTITLKETNLFSIYGIGEDTILKSCYDFQGCELVIEKTEALTVIDVNSKGKELNLNREQNNLEINLTLCSKIVQLIVLKNISGIIIVDFISMKEKSGNDRLIAELKQSFKHDRNQVKIMEVTSLGLVQIVRQRQESDLYERLTKPCSCCKGTGFEANEALKKVRAEELIQLIGYEAGIEKTNEYNLLFTKEEQILLEERYKEL